MESKILFGSSELARVDEMLKLSEELINNYFKMSSSVWLKNRYDVKTAKDLDSHETVIGPFAQVVKYEGRKKEALLGSSSFSFYKVCLQDETILSAVAKTNSLSLDAFLLYILTHELVHVVRFSKFKHRYENKDESDMTFDEEKKVHWITHDILKNVSFSGLSQVFDFYKNWIQPA